MLERVDWDFPATGTTAGSVHALHWFPGNFIPQIPGALVQALSQPRAQVFDPFAGSGTTAIEALRLGRNAIVSDRLSICTAICEGKVAAVTEPVGERKRVAILNRCSLEAICRSEECGARGEGSSPILSEWYSPETLSQLRYIWSVIEECESATRKILTLLFSDLLFKCASTKGARTSTGKLRRHHWGWIADNVCPKRPENHDALSIFRTQVMGLRGVEKLPADDCGAAIIRQDARALALNDESADLIVTSPPYLGVIDYTRANRLLYAWMGWAFDEERAEEIGARYKRQRLHCTDEYLWEMSASWGELYRVLRHGGHMAIIIGSSRKFSGIVRRTIADLERYVDLIWGPVSRQPSRRRLSDRTATAPLEYIYVFRKA